MTTGSRSQLSSAITATKPQAPPSQTNSKAVLCEKVLSSTFAKAETRWINCLRAAVLFVLLIAAIVLSTGVFLYTRKEEQTKFNDHFEDSAHQVMESFHDMVERNIGAAASLSTTLTSYAMDQNLSFPFVTLPDFALRGAHARIESGSHVIHYSPLVTDDKRAEWQDYAFENRHHIDEAFEADEFCRTKQDLEIEQSRQRFLHEHEEESPPRNMTVLEDGTGFHPNIWNNGALDPSNRGDEPQGSGPYLPAWQRSPIEAGRQELLNLNFLETKVIGHGLLETMTSEKKAVLRAAAVPIPKYKAMLERNMQISQFRENVEDYIDGLSTFLAYPIFGSFDQDHEVVGILATNVYWKVLLSFLLPASSTGIICVIENSYNQTFSYRIDGSVATYLGTEDVHNEKFRKLGVETSVNAYLKDNFSARNRAYPTVPLSDEVQYWLRVYPSQDTEDQFITNKPAIYTAVIICFFVFASALFLMFSYVVERRQNIMLEKVVENANSVALAERELNEFLSHEVRNPLAAALSATSFLSSALNEPSPLSDSESQKCAQEDIEVVNSSLSFINDFLRSMLDMNRNQITIEKSPADVLHDILEPVSAILYKRVANFEVILDCSQGLIIQTDAIRLKQVVLNLARNSSKFVEHGFVRMRARVEKDQSVFIYVEDSGPGVPEGKRNDLFQKYQTSLDLLSQGTGLGLSLAKKLMDSLGGDIYLDQNYDSGVAGCPGACFVLQLNTAPMDIESTLPPSDDSTLEFQDTGFQGNGTVSGSEPKAPHLSNLGALPEAAIVSPRDAPPGPVESSTPATLPVLPTELSVLFVDDDAVLRKLFVRGLKRTQPSWAIQQASSGEMALKILDESPCPDLIFLDQYMASAEKSLLGTETVTAMRSRGVKSIICGLSANDIRDNFVRAGADAFLLKPMPCKPESLRKVLVDLLDAKKVSTRNLDS